MEVISEKHQKDFKRPSRYESEENLEVAGNFTGVDFDEI